MFLAQFGEVNSPTVISSSCVLVIDFNYLDGRDVEMVIKELAAIDYTCNRVSSYVFNRP